MITVFGILGILGGVLCACGDLFLDLKGKDNQKLGRYQFIESSWEKMAGWRFKVSILFAMAGVPLYFLGLTAMAAQLAKANAAFGLAFWIISLVGSTGGFFIHALLCLTPVIYKILIKKTGFEFTETVLNQMFETIRLPFYLMFILLVGVTSLMLCCAVFAGWLAIPPLMLLLTPLCLMLIGITLRCIKPGWFYDLPGIIMPSMGLAMIGLMAVVAG